MKTSSFADQQPSESVRFQKYANFRASAFVFMNTYLGVWLLLLCLLSVPITFAGKDIKIEGAQRAFQARYHLVTGEYVSWPDCACGPAPNYPNDDFYGDLSKDPEKGRELVTDLRDKFFCNPAYMIVIYTYFSKDDPITLEGKDTLAYFQQSDFPFESLQSITANNYWIRFISLSNNCISKLQYLPIHGHQTKADSIPSIDGTDYVQFQGEDGDDDNYSNLLSPPEEARENAEDHYDEFPPDPLPYQ